MDLFQQILTMVKITTEKPLLLGAILTSGWLVGTLVSSVASNDFTGLLALSQAALILLESNLVGALWFIGKITVIYLAIKMIILLFKLCRTDCARKAMIYEYFKKMTPFFEQMFVFFFTLFIDSDRLGQRIEEIIEKKACKQFSKQNESIKCNKTKQLTLKLLKCIKHIIQQKMKLQSKDIENTALFPNCNLSKQNNLTSQMPLTNSKQKKTKRHKKRPIIKVILSNASNATGHDREKRLYVRAIISSSSTCSLITENAAKKLQLVPKSLWPVLVRESASQPIRVCWQTVQVRMEAIKPHEHICHTMEMMLVQKIASCSAKVDLLIGQDIFNWTVNILPVQKTHFLPNGGAEIDTKFGVVNIGSERFDEEDKLRKNAVEDAQMSQERVLSKPVTTTYNTITLPWRELKEDEENRGCVRDMTLLFAFPLILGLFSYFDLLLLLTLLITSFILPIWCIFDRTIFSSPENQLRKLLHSATENLFIFIYALKLLWTWMWKQSFDPKDPVLYKPTLTVRVRSLDTECLCRVLFDTTRAQSYIARSAVQHLGKMAPGKAPGRVQVQMEALHDSAVCSTVELVPSKRLLFADYLPTPPRELREVMSVQYGVRLTDDTPEAQTFGTADIIVGTELLADCFCTPGRSACIYLAPNLVLTPTRYGHTLAGSHYPLLQKSLHTIFTSHSRVLRYLSQHLIPFVGSCMVRSIVISVLWDSYWYLGLVSDISTYFQYQYKIEYFSNCDNFRAKTDSIYLLNATSYLPKMASCWLYQNTF